MDQSSYKALQFAKNVLIENTNNLHMNDIILVKNRFTLETLSFFLLSALALVFSLNLLKDPGKKKKHFHTYLMLASKPDPVI